jgi:tetrahydromethanopterin S-methyltransferase subunit G
MPDPGVVIDRNEERLRRLAVGEAAQRARSRRRQRTVERTGKRFGRAAAVIAAVVIGLFLWGLIVGPIGIGGFMLAILFGALAAMAAALSVGEQPAPEVLADAAPLALAVATDAWLDRQRRALPALAAPSLDMISARLATLETQLASVPPQDPVAQDVGRLLGRHLPELVDRYTRVPAEQRTRTLEGDGKTLETTLVDGLKVVEVELGRASDALAAADRDALVYQGKFLENRYKGE